MKTLIINHKIYGRFKITEPVLIELIKSKSLQRLKKIDQLGAWHLHQDFKGFFSRYQHSIGVMLLLRKFNASLEEQIAGLLHDASHTAFSHIIDFVFNSQSKQSYQDSKLTQAFEIQWINKILRKYDVSPKKILNFENFSLLENELPNICADRIDYTLQDPLGQKISANHPKDFLDNLTVHNNKFVFKNQLWAKKFAKLYLEISQKLWCGPEHIALYQLLSDAIKIGLNKKIITKKDLFTTDKVVLKKLKNSGETEILGRIKLIKNLKVKLAPRDQADICNYSKARAVDPYFLKNDKLIRLSTADKTYRKEMNDWLKKARKGFCMKILNK